MKEIDLNRTVLQNAVVLEASALKQKYNITPFFPQYYKLKKICKIAKIYIVMSQVHMVLCGFNSAFGSLMYCRYSVEYYYLS